jgi:hypothetical protein
VVLCRQRSGSHEPARVHCSIRHRERGLGFLAESRFALPGLVPVESFDRDGMLLAGTFFLVEIPIRVRGMGNEQATGIGKTVACDTAQHFVLLNTRLCTLGVAVGVAGTGV